jgi:hypothetical protein
MRKAQMSLEDMPNKPRTRPRRVSLKAHGQARSRVSNGKVILPGLIDGRSEIARRYRDISSAIVTDMGGADHCSESRKQLIRRFSAAAVLAEQMESKLANGEEIDAGVHCQLSSTMVRIAHRIGIARIPRDAGTLDNDDVLAVYRSHLNGTAHES